MSARVTACGCSSAEIWPQSAMTTCRALGIAAAISATRDRAASAHVVLACDYERRAANEREVRPRIDAFRVTVCCRTNASGPTSSAIVRTISCNARSF